MHNNAAAVAASRVPSKHVLFCICSFSIFYAINQNRHRKFHEAHNNNKIDDSNINNLAHHAQYTRYTCAIVFISNFPLKYNFSAAKCNVNVCFWWMLKQAFASNNHQMGNCLLYMENHWFFSTETAHQHISRQFYLVHTRLAQIKRMQILLWCHRKRFIWAHLEWMKIFDHTGTDWFDWIE